MSKESFLKEVGLGSGEVVSSSPEVVELTYRLVMEMWVEAGDTGQLPAQQQRLSCYFL